MSFIILILIIILLYASLSKYRSIFKVFFMAVLISGMTAVFFTTGIRVFENSDAFVILNTEMNRVTFIHACAVWSAADILVIFKIIKNYRKYIKVNL